MKIYFSLVTSVLAASAVAFTSPVDPNIAFHPSSKQVSF
uniref:Uncharacterized protein n=1 Tax=Nelumbo nucifera TaxID=4432 RepID=A0A822XEH6_NELNU|nr:TPA_asm: hypothetical protein HUJ06_019516 [Nelumbo nucifera]